MNYQLKIKNKIKIQKNRGAAMIILVFFFMSISLTILIGIVTPVVREFKIARANFNSKQAYFLAESGIEDAMYRIKTSKQIGTSENLVLGTSSTITTITNLSSSQKQISSLGDTSSNQRKVDLVISTGIGVSFNYGIQVGQGGVDMTGSSGINGNVYANGPITGSSSSFITGTAISGNAPALSADQSNGTGTPANNITFGNATATQDIAQSFQINSETPVNKLSFYIKKVGSPSNATVRIVTDTSGSPSTTTIASGALSASTVTTSYGWVEVALSTNPTLDIGTSYWVVIDASNSSSNYYIIGASGDNYANGLAKIGRYANSWGSTTPSNIDLYFNVYLGGMNGSIAGSSESQWNQMRVGTGGSGSAQAHTVNYTNATGNIYCISGTGNNKSCTNQSDPVYQSFPVSDANIAQWKSDAQAGGTISGNYSVGGSNTVTLGPKYITGNLDVGGSGILKMSGTIFVEGNITLSGSGQIKLDTSYGSNDGVLITNGIIDNGGSGQFLGSGTTGSYIMALTTSNCDSSFCSSDAIEIGGSARSVILYAPNGTIEFAGSASAKEAVGYKIKLSGSATVTYDSGLANASFVSGPSGSWNVSSWKETE